MLTEPCNVLNDVTLTPFLEKPKRVSAVIWQAGVTADNLSKEIVSD